MKLISAAKYAALQTRYQQVIAQRDKAQELAAKRLTTITRQAEEITRLRDLKPDGAVRQPQPVQGDVEVRRQLHLVRKAMAALDLQCRDLQHINEVQARQLRERSEKAREVGAP